MRTCLLTNRLLAENLCRCSSPTLPHNSTHEGPALQEDPSHRGTSQTQAIIMRLCAKEPILYPISIPISVSYILHENDKTARTEIC